MSSAYYFKDMHGFLANVVGTAENLAVKALGNGSDIWLGASQDEDGVYGGLYWPVLNGNNLLYSFPNTSFTVPAIGAQQSYLPFSQMHPPKPFVGGLAMLPNGNW
jgi:hypothetical protein